MFDFLFNPQGRISRKGWWLGFTLPYLSISIAANVLAGLSPMLGILSLLAFLFYLWPSMVAVPVKRFHDLGMTGFWQLGFVVAEVLLTIAFFVGVGVHAAALGMEDDFAALGTMSPEEQSAVMVEVFGGALGNPIALVSAILLVVINLVWLYFQGIRRGQAGPNEHGEDPLASGRGFAD